MKTFVVEIPIKVRNKDSCNPVTNAGNPLGWITHYLEFEVRATDLQDMQARLRAMFHELSRRDVIRESR